MQAKKKEELGYIIVFTIGLVHIYLIAVFNLTQTGGLSNLTGNVLSIFLLAAAVAAIGGILFFISRKGFSLLSTLGIIDPTEDMDEFGFAKCGKCGARIQSNAYLCHRCGTRFRYDREDILLLVIFTIGILVIYWVIVSDYIIGGTGINIDRTDQWLMMVALVITGLGIIPFAFKRAGFSTVALFFPGRAAGWGIGSEDVTKMQIVGGMMDINVAGGNAGALGGGGIGGGGGTGSQFMPFDPNDPLSVRQYQMELKMREMEMQQRMENQMRDLKAQLEMEQKKKERFRQMLAESRMEGMEMRQKVEEAETTKRTLIAPRGGAVAPSAGAGVAIPTAFEGGKSKTKRSLFPFAAMVGQNNMRRALMLNAINPEIGGVLIRGQKGTGKSVSVRGLAEILPEIEIVKGCRFSCDPNEPDKFCWECEEKLKEGNIETETRAIRVVDLPLNTTEDRLVGSIDLEKVLTEGVRAFEPGIMAEAHRGLLYVDEINLLDDYVVDVLLDSAAMGVNTVERESVSVSHPSKFIIVGSMNPEEGELRPQLLDRIALQVEVKGIEDIEERIEIMRRREDFNQDPQSFRQKYETKQREIKERIESARKILPSVVTPPNILQLIAKICVAFNVDGHRADIIIERAARSNAAYEGRRETTIDDVILAAEMALPHRMRKQPFEEEVFSSDLLRQVVKRFEAEV